LKSAIAFLLTNIGFDRLIDRYSCCDSSNSILRINSKETGFLLNLSATTKANLQNPVSAGDRSKLILHQSEINRVFTEFFGDYESNAKKPGFCLPLDLS
jgi:hypothetical protein